MTMSITPMHDYVFFIHVHVTLIHTHNYSIGYFLTWPPKSTFYHIFATKQGTDMIEMLFYMFPDMRNSIPT